MYFISIITFSSGLLFMDRKLGAFCLQMLHKFIVYQHTLPLVA